VIDAVLDGGAKFASEILQPINAIGDRQGCKRNPDGSVTTPKGFREAYKQMSDDGWMAISADQEWGGQGLPRVVSMPFLEMCSSANMAFSMYPGLTRGAAEAIQVGGSDEQKKIYLTNMMTGKWSGTMNLTEPQCGTDLGLIRTKAVPQPDGSYKITGQKIWISGGEQDRAEHHPARPRAHRGWAGRHQGHLALHRAEVHREARRLARRPQFLPVRRSRREDGHPRQRDVRDEL
jgi:alkylation response protein AidB-like acyl-CoA dehydrogenase